MNTDQAIEYLISQTRENISFLQSVQRISPENARDILSKIPANHKAPFPASVYDNPTDRPTFTMSTLATRPPPPIPPATLFRVKALWAYNEDHRETADLTFSSGDILEVTDNKKPDWWSGRLNGKEGQFPASYVERLQDSVPPRPFPIDGHRPYPEQFIGTSNFPNGSAYSAPYPSQNAYHGPPPRQNGPYPSYPPPHQQPPPTVAVTESHQNGGKKHGFFNGGLGNTLAQTAVGGVGFGAGSAVGSGIVNSIF